jgi:hypothetical protein
LGKLDKRIPMGISIVEGTRGMFMKKKYQKPVLAKRECLASIAAQIIPISGPMETLPA